MWKQREEHKANGDSKQAGIDQERVRELFAEGVEAVDSDEHSQADGDHRHDLADGDGDHARAQR